MALIILDASVLIAVMDPADALHDGATSAIAEFSSDDLCVSAVTYAECLVGPARAGRLDDAVTRLRALVGVEAPTPHIAERAAQFRALSRSRSLADAFALATADVMGADVVLTADAAWQDALTSVRVIR